jgi:hypothetical protein
MSKKIPLLEPLLKPLSALQKLMEKSNCPWMIIGGIAASLLGKPRFTADVDVVILLEDDKDISTVLKLAKKFGFSPRIKNPVKFAQKNNVLLIRHIRSKINVDISLGFLPFEKDALKRRKLYKIKNLSFYLPAPEDLIIFKAVAHRPQDIIDIQQIINNNPKVDIKYIKKIINEFARVLEMPELWKDIEAIITGKRKRYPKI